MTTLQKFLGFLLVIFLVVLAGLFVKSLVAAAPGISATIIAGIIAFSVGVYTHTQIRNREIKARHFIEKKNAYMCFFNLVFEIISSFKNKRPIIDDRLINEIWGFKKELMVWGDQEVLQAYREYEEKSAAQPEGILLAVDNLLRAIRKDLGHDDSKLKPGELVSILIVAEDREKILAPKLRKE